MDCCVYTSIQLSLSPLKNCILFYFILYEHVSMKEKRTQTQKKKTLVRNQIEGGEGKRKRIKNTAFSSASTEKKNSYNRN